jgi:hypothetical protein
MKSFFIAYKRQHFSVAGEKNQSNGYCLKDVGREQTTSFLIHHFLFIGQGLAGIHLRYHQEDSFRSTVYSHV